MADHRRFFDQFGPSFGHVSDRTFELSLFLQLVNDARAPSCLLHACKIGGPLDELGAVQELDGLGPVVYQKDARCRILLRRVRKG